MAQGRNITKREIADRIATALQRGKGWNAVSSPSILRIIQMFMDEIIEELVKGNRLEFRDFGVFETAVRKARMALNPKTLVKVPTPAKRVVKFKPGRAMAARVLRAMTCGIGIGNPASVKKVRVAEPEPEPELCENCGADKTGDELTGLECCSCGKGMCMVCHYGSGAVCSDCEEGEE